MDNSEIYGECLDDAHKDEVYSMEKSLKECEGPGEYESKVLDSYRELIFSGKPEKAFELSENLDYSIPNKLVDIGYRKYAVRGDKELVEVLHDLSGREPPLDVRKLKGILEQD